MKLLLVDENNLLFRMLDTHKGLLFNNKRTGGVYGFVTLLAKYINLHKPDRIVVCGDSPPLIRRQEYAGYKESRKKLEPEYFKYIIESRMYVRQFLESMGIQRWEVKGYEADDLIAALTHKHWEDNVVICSNDDDLFQLLNSTTVLQRSKDIYTEDMFVKEYDIDTLSWVIVKSLCGNHNDVKPIKKGIGIKTALKLVKKKKFSDMFEDDEGTSAFWKNYALVILPHQSFNDEWIPELTPKVRITERDLDNFLLRLGIQPTTQMYNAFIGE